jgi:hypothetical protein
MENGGGGLLGRHFDLTPEGKTSDWAPVQRAVPAYAAAPFLFPARPLYEFLNVPLVQGFG